MNKNIFAAALFSLSLFTPFNLCKAAPVQYTNYIDMDEHYTGVIIDCRGLGLETAMSPVIEDLRGRKLYGHKNLNPQIIATRGMAGYAIGFKDTAIARAGRNPIILRAVRVNHNNTYPVIDEADAVLLHYSNVKHNYLNEGAVVFVR